MAGTIEIFPDWDDKDDLLFDLNYLHYEDFDAAVKMGKTGVFWDAMDYPFPPGLSPDGIYHKIESALRDCCDKDVDLDIMGEISIWVYVDKTKEPWCDINLKEKTWKSRIYFLPGGDKSGRRSRVLHDLHLWAMDFPVINPRPSSLVVVADQVRCDYFFMSRLNVLSAVCFRVFLADSPKIYRPENELEWPASVLYAVYSIAEKMTLRYNKPHKPHTPKKHKPNQDVEGSLGERKCLRVEDFSTIVEGGQRGVFWDCLPRKNEDFSCTERTILVFWNVMQCPVPDGATVPCVAGNIRSAFYEVGIHRCVNLHAYGDDLGQQDAFVKDGNSYYLEAEHLRTNPFAETQDYGEMAVDLILFATPSYKRPAILAVIPKPEPDSELHRVLKCLESRKHEVLVVNPPAGDNGRGLFLQSAQSVRDCIQRLDGEPISRPRCGHVLS